MPPAKILGMALAALGAWTAAAMAAASAQPLDKVSLRHQLGGGGRARRFLSGARRRHLQEVRARRHHRARRAEREQPHPAAGRQDRLLPDRQHAAGRSTRSRRTCRRSTSPRFSRRTRRCSSRIPIRASNKFEDLKKLTLFVSKEGMASYFQWLKADYGFTRTARSSPTPSIRSPSSPTSNSAMQGYVTSEPFAIEKEAQFKPKVFLLAD